MAPRVIIHNHYPAVADARMFPSITLAELEAKVASGWNEGTRMAIPPETIAKMKAEIEARKSGASVVKVTPQVGWGPGGPNMKPIGKIGRM